MPGVAPIVSGIAAGIGTFLTSTSPFFVVARLVTAVAATALISKRLAGYDPGIAGRAITTRGTVEPQALIYGEVQASGLVFFNDVSGENGRFLWSAIALAGHEVDAITDIWLDDEFIPESTINGGSSAGGAVTSGFFGPQDGVDIVEVWKYQGTATQTAQTDLVSAFSSWTSAHRARGIAYIVTRFNLFNRSEAIWDSKEPRNIRAKVRGKAVYDPRDDTGGAGDDPTNPSFASWSDNPALCVADYLLNTKFGLGLAPSRIDWAAIVTVANYCDATVPIPTASTEKRFTCNGVLYGTATHRDNLTSLLTSCNGELTVSAGLWTLRAGYVAPDVNLTADDVISPLGIKATLEPSERFNTAVAQFIDKDDQYAAAQTPEVFTTAYRDRDNGVILQNEVELPMTDSFYMAQRLLWQQLNVANQEQQVSGTFNLRMAQQAVGGRVNLTVDELNWQPRIFKVQQWELMETGAEDGIGCQVELRVDSASAYLDPLESNYTVRNATGGYVFADPGVSAPSGLTATAALDAGIIWSWNNPADFSDADEAVLYTSPDSSWSNAVEAWRGRADTVTLLHDPGQEVFGWVRMSRAGILSLRNPDSDTSNVSAVAPEYSLPNLVPVGYSAFDSIAPNDITFGAAVANNGGVSIGSTLSSVVGKNNLRWEALSDFRMTGADAVALSRGGEFNIRYPTANATEMQVVAYINPRNFVSTLHEIRWILQGASTSASSAWEKLEDIAVISQGNYAQVSFAIDVSAFTETQFRLTLEISNQNNVATSGFQDADITFDGIMLLDTTFFNIPPDVP